MPCLVCQRDIRIAAKGLCGACYERLRKHGTTEYLRKGKYSVCHIAGCEDRAISNGLCDKHRQRMRKHGHVNQTRPEYWGAKEKHPLYGSWQHMRRYSANTPMCEEWKSDFFQFVVDVGARPSPKHKLFSGDCAKPLGPGNFIWKKSVVEKHPDEDQKTYQARAARVYRKIRSEAYTEVGLKSRYGLTRSEYLQMLEAQGHACAICQKPETTMIRGTVLSLAVDHDHDTGKVRGLLCRECNHAIGLLKDDPDILRKAIEYLETHRLAS